MDLNYLVFLYFGTIITPALLLAAFYAHIYQVVLKQLRQIVTMHPEKGSSTKGVPQGGTMIRMLGVQQTNEVKATQNLAIIVLFFMICWIPLYTINCILAFRQEFHVNETFMQCCIILSHMNSAGNPLLYAYHLRDFRAAMKNFFCSLFDTKQKYCDTFKGQCYHDKYKRASCTSTCHLTSTRRCTRVKLLEPNKVTSTIVKASTTVAAATAGKANNRAIWNISEHSASSSSESVKSNGTTNHERLLMIRPATPFRPRKLSEINSAYVSTMFGEDSDDGFNEEETLPYHDYSLDDYHFNVFVSKSRTPKIISHSDRTYSNSSPQLSKSLFFVEASSCRNTMTELVDKDDETTKSGSFNLSPFKIVNVFHKRRLNRSLSDSGSFCTKSIRNNENICST
ncbi:unnamed protein product [Acanthoscelides obtectus]|uniref:G-protein coupled receptors family 1 profile domain-containing protein n=1 Tax=Acanthoscelides obtectus TaxID=200917 RepID=A0A9P0PTM5_ACAOB|nr:unnamed protein product [Acanthoscelides obtectus]CAK1668233.1 Adenosine receptor A2b [Acanthoscelides obtectus]